MRICRPRANIRFSSLLKKDVKNHLKHGKLAFLLCLLLLFIAIPDVLKRVNIYDLKFAKSFFDGFRLLHLC